ncbi:MAG: thiol peroxidase [Desulfovibrionaceae bacterium]|nr:thiol peroxidase [Desulfovibrionaceae bacterium]
MIERPQAITFAGTPMTLVGNPVQVGDKAPDFTVIANDMTSRSLSDYAGKVVVINCVPSLDTPICDTQTRWFNKDIAGMYGDQAVVLTISCDLPFAQKRWCGAAGIEGVETLSDYRELQFSQGFGVLIKELRLIARSAFVIDRDGKIAYAQVLPEVKTHLDYDAVKAAVASLF